MNVRGYKMNTNTFCVSDRILVRNPNVETVTKGGLTITGARNPNDLVWSKVEMHGNGKYENGHLVPISVSIGDEVAFTNSIALQNKVVLDGVEYIVLREENVILIRKGTKDKDTNSNGLD
jgi:co-chaperonin GroES (HSP10)